MVAVTIVGAAASSRDGLGLVHLRLVRIVIDVVLTLGRRTTLKRRTNQDSEGRSVGRYRWTVDDGAVGGDGVFPLLHHGHLAATVIRGVGQTVDGAALRTGRDGHAGNGLGALHAVDCARPQQILLHLLEQTHIQFVLVCTLR